MFLLPLAIIAAIAICAVASFFVRHAESPEVHPTWTPTAVGSYGNPPAPWRESYPMSENGEKYGHSSYWIGTDSAVTAARFLGIPAAHDVRSAALGDRALPPVTDLPERPLEGRALPRRF